MAFGSLIAWMITLIPICLFFFFEYDYKMNKHKKRKKGKKLHLPLKITPMDYGVGKELNKKGKSNQLSNDQF